MPPWEALGVRHGRYNRIERHARFDERGSLAVTITDAMFRVSN